MDPSIVEIDNVQGKHRLTSCKSIQPLKILNPDSDAAAHIVLSSFGGGMLAGDQVNLQIHGKRNSRFYLGTQSNSRVFKASDEKTAVQVISGKLDENSVGVYLPDPLIMHSQSRYKQLQEWHLNEGSLLFLVDWFASGRAEMGEEFQFSEYHSEVKVFYKERLLVFDKLGFSPQDLAVRSSGVFGRYNYFLNGFVVAGEDNDRYKSLKQLLLSLNPDAESARENAQQGTEDVMFVTDAVKPGLVSFRAMAMRRQEIEEYVKVLSAQLASPDLLGFDPWRRRF